MINLIGYHITKEKIKDSILIPKIPKNSYTERGVEDNTIPRVCFSNNVSNCITALCDSKLTGEILYVYKTKQDKEFYFPTREQVPDYDYTHEMWSLEPIEVEYQYKIKVGELLINEFGYCDDRVDCMWYVYDYKVLPEGE
mgnify:CR=1 FL=1